MRRSCAGANLFFFIFVWHKTLRLFAFQHTKQRKNGFSTQSFTSHVDVSEIKILPSTAHSQCAPMENNSCTISRTTAYSDMLRLEKAHWGVLYWSGPRMTLHNNVCSCLGGIYLLMFLLLMIVESP